MVGRLVVAAHKHRQHGRPALPGIVLVELAQRSVFRRASQALEVVEVADGLKVPADDEELDLLVFAFALFSSFLSERELVELGDGRVDAVEVAVAAALDGDLVVLMVAVVFFFFFLSKKRLRRERKSLSKIFSCRRRPIAED